MKKIEQLIVLIRSLATNSNVSLKLRVSLNPRKLVPTNINKTTVLWFFFSFFFNYCTRGFIGFLWSTLVFFRNELDFWGGSHSLKMFISNVYTYFDIETSMSLNDLVLIYLYAVYILSFTTQ